MKTSELTGAALDWAVAQCEGENSVASCYYDDNVPLYLDGAPHHVWEPSENWAQGGAIIERERIELQYMDNFESWAASMVHEFGQESFAGYGKNPLVAAMRCYVASKLGDEVEVPEELLSCAHE